MRRHLRRLVVAHAIHGRQMRGYFARGARTLTDIDEEKAVCLLMLDIDA